MFQQPRKKLKKIFIFLFKIIFYLVKIKLKESIQQRRKIFFLSKIKTPEIILK